MNTIDAKGGTVLLEERNRHWYISGPNFTTPAPIMKRTWSNADRFAKSVWHNAIFKSIDMTGEVHIDDCTHTPVDFKERFDAIFKG